MPIPELLRLPYREFVIESRLPRELAIRDLRKAVAPRRWFRFSKVQEPFEGEVWADGFRIRRTILKRNPFLPLILGKFQNAPIGSRVQITMRPILPVLVVWLVWMGFALLPGVLGIFSPPRGGGLSRGLAMVVVAGLVAFGYLLASIAFGIEARKARRILTQILTGSTATAEAAATLR
jgi:hypothetical protein